MPSLTELEENLLSGGESRSEAIAIMKDVGEDIEKCKSQLLDLKKQVKKFQGICKATTAFGTAMNVTGAALTTGITVFCDEMTVCFISFFMSSGNRGSALYRRCFSAARWHRIRVRCGRNRCQNRGEKNQLKSVKRLHFKNAIAPIRLSIQD